MCMQLCVTERAVDSLESGLFLVLLSSLVNIGSYREEVAVILTI